MRYEHIYKWKTRQNTDLENDLLQRKNNYLLPSFVYYTLLSKLPTNSSDSSNRERGKK